MKHSTCARPTRIYERVALPRAALAWVAVCSVFTLFAASGAAAAEYEANAVKAAFLHRFAAYVEWPRRDSDRSVPFTIAVMHGVDVASHLERLLPGLTIHGRRAQVRNIGGLSELGDAQILYIGAAQAVRTKALLETLAGRPILIVTDQTDGLASGSIINFVQVGRNVRFEVSLPAARRNGLQINSGLLSVAVRVEDIPRGDARHGGDDILLAARSRCVIEPPAIRVRSAGRTVGG